MTSSALVLMAAAEGFGVGLARRRLAETAIAAGRLVELDSLSLPLGTAYWVLHRPDPRSAEVAVLDWLRSEVA